MQVLCFKLCCMDGSVRCGCGSQVGVTGRCDGVLQKGFTPLHIAAKYGNVKVARLLLLKEAVTDAPGKNGLTPLHVATHYNHVNVAQLLLENRADWHASAKVSSAVSGFPRVAQDPC